MSRLYYRTAQSIKGQTPIWSHSMTNYSEITFRMSGFSFGVNFFPTTTSAFPVRSFTCCGPAQSNYHLPQLVFFCLWSCPFAFAVRPANAEFSAVFPIRTTFFLCLIHSWHATTTRFRAVCKHTAVSYMRRCVVIVVSHTAETCAGGTAARNRNRASSCTAWQPEKCFFNISRVGLSDAAVARW